MSKQILVQAQADYIASLSRSSPILALEELIWNALDADAHEVKVDLIVNQVNGIDAIRISDDGTGVDVLRQLEAQSDRNGRCSPTVARAAWVRAFQGFCPWWFRRMADNGAHWRGVAFLSNLGRLRESGRL